jgi:hypothetical protein
VAELTGSVELSGWPQGTRLIVRRERPHPGAQLSFSDVDGHRFTCFLTDQPDADIGRARATPPPPRPRRGPHPLRQAHGTLQPALPRLRPQQGLARACAVAQDLFAWPGGSSSTATCAWPSPAPAPPTAAHGRTTRALRPSHQAARRARLALGRGARGRLQAPARAAARRGRMNRRVFATPARPTSQRRQRPLGHSLSHPRTAVRPPKERKAPPPSLPHAPALPAHRTVRDSDSPLHGITEDRG